MVSEADEMAMHKREMRPIETEWPSPGDIKPDNFGWLDDRLVRLDYDMNYNGCPHDRSGFVNAATLGVDP